jgi:hypothetical protein
MKRTVFVFLALVVLAGAVGATGNFWDGMSDARRYDLADAYAKVADRYEEVGEKAKADDFRAMAQNIYPGYQTAQRPEGTPVTQPAPVRPAAPAPDPAGAEAARYYFAKLLRGVFSENLSLTLSVLADTLYVPYYDRGLTKDDVAGELEWFFDTYDATSIAPSDVFLLDSIVVVPLENGYWRLEVEVADPYVDALPDVTFWSARQGYYFRRYPEGWRLAAIGAG